MSTTQQATNRRYYFDLNDTIDGNGLPLDRGTYAVTAHNDDEVEFVGIADAPEVADMIVADFAGRMRDIERGNDRMPITRYCVFDQDGTAVRNGGRAVVEVLA